MGLVTVGTRPAGSVPCVVDLGEAEVDRHAGGLLGRSVELLAGIAVHEGRRWDIGPVGVVDPQTVGIGVQVVGRPTLPVTPVVLVVGVVAGVNQRRGPQLVASAAVGARVGEQRPVEAFQQRRVRCPCRTNRTDDVRRGGLEHGHQSGDATLHDLLIDHVGLVETGLRMGPGDVVDFDGQRRTANVGSLGTGPSTGHGHALEGQYLGLQFRDGGFCLGDDCAGHRDLGVDGRLRAN